MEAGEMRRPKKANRPKKMRKLLQIHRNAEDQIFVDNLVKKIDAKIEQKPGWQKLKPGEDYDLDSFLRLKRFHKRLLREEAELMMHKFKKQPRKN